MNIGSHLPQKRNCLTPKKHHEEKYLTSSKRPRLQDTGYKNELSEPSSQNAIFRPMLNINIPSPCLTYSNSSSPDNMFDENYTNEYIIGKGACSQVYLVRENNSGKYYAMKKANSDYPSMLSNCQERETLLSLDHPFIVKAFPCLEPPYLLTEYASGGDMFAYLHETNSFNHKIPETHAKFYASQILLALEYLHQRHIVHRDIKSENIVFDIDGYLKMIDFGVARVIPLKSYDDVGTPVYKAPEMISSKGHGKEVDIWAFAVLIYEMVVGKRPFSVDDRGQLRYSILEGKINYPSFLSTEIKDLLMRMFIKDPKKRISLKNIRHHEWFQSIDWNLLILKQIPAPWLPPPCLRTKPYIIGY